MNSNGARRRQDAVQQVIGTILEENERETCERLMGKADISYKTLGISLRFHRMQPESLTALRRSQQEMPWNFEVHYHTAIQELRCGLEQEAKKSALRGWNEVNKAISCKGTSDYFLRRKTDIARLLGDICAALEEAEQAQEWWNKSVRCAPDKASAVVDASRRLVHSGNAEQAQTLLLQELELAESDPRVRRELEEVERVRACEAQEGSAPGAADKTEELRVSVLIDVANFEADQRKGEFSGSLQFDILLDLIAPGAQVVSVDAFVPDFSESMNGVGEQLRRLGFTIRPIRSRWVGGRLKADADAALASWMMLRIIKDAPDEVWIVSSDEDFGEVVDAAHELRPDVRVCFAGLDQNGHSELARRGDRWLALPDAASSSPLREPELAVA